MAFTAKKLSGGRIWLMIALVTVVATFAACGGSGDNAGSGVVIVTAGAGDISDAGSGVIGGIDPDSGQGSPTATQAVQGGTPTPIPPDKTTDEEGTARLVDELSAETYPRTSARIIEREFRNEPQTAQQKIGNAFVIQGDVLEAGKDASGQPFVHFKAGAGRVTCHFEVITDAELLRFSPDGTNAVVGTVDAWDAENRILTVRDCRVVLGF